MQEHELLKLVDAILCYHLLRDTVHTLEVVGGLDEGAHIEIG